MALEPAADTVLSIPGTPFSLREAGCLGVRILEAQLTVNVARFGDMHIFAQVAFGPQIWRTQVSRRTGMKPK